MEFKLVVLVRGDLNISEGKLAVQVAHASVMCALESRGRASSWFKKWMNEGQRKVVLRVDDLEELEELERRARNGKLVACLVQDAGLTELPPGTTTCLGIGPAPNHALDPITGKLPLW